MRIAIFSDLHIGFGKGTARQDEAFEQARQAFELALKEKADLILLQGDLFNEAIPTQEAWLQMFQLFSFLRKENHAEKSTVKKSGREKIEHFEFNHVPVISIAGTHEFRSKDFKNALEVLQEAGCLVYLHESKAEFEKNGEKLAVHGLSGVPEKRSLEVLQAWNPKPEPSAINILMLHQSIKEFLPFDDDMVATISLNDLPKGFDLIIDGHLHWSSEEHLEKNRLLVPGSTVVTQMKRLESTKPKGIYLFETKESNLRFIQLPNQRKFLFEKIEFKDASIEEIKQKAEKKLSEILSNANGKPLVKLKLKGSLAKGLAAADIDLTLLEERFKEKALLFIGLEFEEPGFKQKLQELRQAQFGKKSIAAMGFELIEKNLAETSFQNAFDVKRIFDLLAEGNIDKVVELLSESKGAEAIA